MIRVMAVLLAVSAHIGTPDSRSLIPNPYENVQQQPSFSTRTESVRVDVLVTEGGRIVRGLGPADFEIRDEGVVQDVDLVSFEQLPIHVILALDLSYSVSGERLRDLRSASHALLDALGRDDRASLLTFNHAVSRRSTPRPRSAGCGRCSTRWNPRASTAQEAPPSRTPRTRLWFRERTKADARWHSCSATASTREAGCRRAACSTWPGGPAWSSTACQCGDPAARSRRSQRGHRGAAMEAESTRNLRAVFIRVLEEFRSRYLVSFSPKGGTRVDGTGSR